MKKILTVLLVVVLAMSAVVALVACTPEAEKSAVEKAIEAAQKMTLAELEAAAKKEFTDNPNAYFNADSLTSGIKKALKEFTKQYDWINYGTEKVVNESTGKEEEVTTKNSNASYNSKKGSEYQPKLTAAYDANAYIADFVMIQDASFVKSLVDEKFLLSYVPQGDGFKFDANDTNPMVGVTFNKVFMYNCETVGKNNLQNVWQLAGKDGKTLKAIQKLSFQNPLGEDINMSFLIMLTSPDACKKLEAAYESYFGEKYDGSKDDYVNIGYKFVAEYIKNVSTWHSSDTTEVKKIDEYSEEGRVVFAGLCKLKDYPGYNDGSYKTKISGAGWNNEVAGFPGFVYNMWIMIPRTCKLPYTACLFTRYLLTQEGYEAGWGGILGYYSANQNIASVDGDPALSAWKQKAVVEDVDYINGVYSTVVKFINQQLAKAK